ncbi:MAG: cupin domain-containing protein [Actinobacteria bacterium]|nr:cupin domain-containing protein [Actinomycetota bacterium]
MRGEQPRVIASAEAPAERVETPGFQRTIKRLLSTSQMVVHMCSFDVGQAGSRHVHADAEEVTYVVDGVGEVLLDDGELRLAPGSVFHGPRNTVHQFRNTGARPLVTVSVYSPPAELPIHGNVEPRARPAATRAAANAHARGRSAGKRVRAARS